MSSNISKINFIEKILVDEASINNIQPSPNNILYSYFTSKSLHIIDASSLQELYSRHLSTPIHRLKWSNDLMFFVILSNTKSKLEVIKFSTTSNDFIPFYSISSKSTQFKYFKVISHFLIIIEEFSLSLKVVDLYTKKVLIITDPKFANHSTFTWNSTNTSSTTEHNSNKVNNISILRRLNLEDVVTVVDLDSLKIISEFKLSLLKLKQANKKEGTKQIKPEITFIKQIDEMLLLLVDNTNNAILIYTIFGHLRNSFYSESLGIYFPFIAQINTIENNEILLYNYNSEIIKINRITEEVTVLDIKGSAKKTHNSINISYFSEEEKKIHFINHETEILRLNKPFKITKFTTHSNCSSIKKDKLGPYSFISISSNNRFLYVVLEDYKNTLFVLCLTSFAFVSTLKLKREIKKIAVNKDKCLITTGNRDLVLWADKEFYSLKIESSVCRKINDVVWNGKKIVLISNVFIFKGILCFW